MARIFRKLAQLLDVNADGITDGQVLVWDDATSSFIPADGGGAGGAPTGADYLVGTANGNLDSEIVVGTSPGGELGGTWASPTVDATHSGSSHASVQAAAEATAAAALSGHASDTTGVHGIADTSALLDTGDIGSTVPAIATFNDHSARHENGGADEITVAGLSGELADPQPTNATKVDAGASTDGQVLTSDGAGGAAWEDVPAGGAVAAADVSIADAANDFTATDVEGALAELQSDHETDAQNLADHLADSTDAHAGTAITNTPAGNVAATTVQAAINELDSEKTTAAAALSAAQTEIADQKRVVAILVSDPLGSAITTGDGKVCFRVPTLLNGHNLVSVGASVSTVSSSGIPTVQLRRMRLSSATAQSAADMLSTKLTIDASEFDSKDATAAAVIDTSNDDVQTGDQINVDIDVAGTGAKGLFVTMTFEAP